MNDDLVFLDSVLLQQDMRIRLPKSLLVNINGVPGTNFWGALQDEAASFILYYPL